MGDAVAEPVFDIRDLTYHYGSDIAALKGISLTVAPGTRVAILGANGSGKSTLLRILDGLLFPSSGSISAFGEPLTEERLQDAAWAGRFRRRVALVFQNPDVQLFNPTVFDEVAFGPLQMRWPREQIRQRVAETLDMLEIAHLKDRSPHRLSGGEKKRVALASVLVLDPEVLLLDEPIAALDPRSRSMVIDFLINWGGGAKTVLTATHDLDIVADIADRALVFQSGRLVAEGRPEALLADTELMVRSSLIHTHRHTHPSGPAHRHPHLHTGHQHSSEP
jgi:cobalt/nickel transport system ATP-binding protein